MEKAIVIPIGNEDGSLSLAEYLERIPENIRMRIKPSFLRDKGCSPIGSHAVIPVRLLSSHRGLTFKAEVVDVEKYQGIGVTADAWLGGQADTREKATGLLAAKLCNSEERVAYSYYVSQGFGYRQVLQKEKQTKNNYASDEEREAKNFYVSIILPADGPGYIEHWITCKRRANNMQSRGEIKGVLYSKKKGLRALEEHNRKFKDKDKK